MIIVGILQIYNEITSGFVQQFCKYNIDKFDAVIAYDDGSTDGTASYCRNHGVKVITGIKNDFKAERFHKAQMIDLADELGADFIVSLDADEILNCSRKKLETLCQELYSSSFMGYSSNYVNLWRSNCYKRKDSLFDDYKPVKLWQHLSGVTPFSDLTSGLHGTLHPDYVKKFAFHSEFIILHTGFSSVERILDKFVRYRSLGQKGRELMRFIDESTLSVEKVPDHYFPSDWPKSDEMLTPLSIREYFDGIEKARERVLRPKVTIFSLIYKDIGWLKFLYQQVLKTVNLDEVEFYFVANDADQSIISFMRENHIPYYEHRNSKEQRHEHYINNVYRAYNYGVSMAVGDCVIMLNSDMALGPGWLESLLKRGGDDVAVASRLIEHGKLSTGRHGIIKNFGASWESFDEDGFHAYVTKIQAPIAEAGGLYMPLLVRRQTFIEVGGFPEGNIVPGSDIFSPEIAGPVGSVISGDAVLIQKLESIGVRHETAFDSVVYHFQEGEKRSLPKPTQFKRQGFVCVCNDSLSGIHGEKVLWNHLLSLPGTVGLDYESVGGKSSMAFLRHSIKHEIDPNIVIQNATFVPRFFQAAWTVMYLQDNLRAMGSASSQQEANLKSADCLIANTIDTAASYSEFDFEICPIGVDERLFSPLDKSLVRRKYGIPLDCQVGIFVGALDSVKGWPEIFQIIKEEETIEWIVVTKYDAVVTHPRIRHFSNQKQEVVVELLNCADFFVLGSRVETQCLAAIEAALCDVPVVIRPVGVFSSLTQDEADLVGYIGHDLRGGILEVLKHSKSCNPRKLILQRMPTLEETADRWWWICCREKMKALSGKDPANKNSIKEVKLITKILNEVDFFYRFKVLRPLIKRDTLYSISEISVYLKRRCPQNVYKLLRFIWRTATIKM